MKYYIVEYEVSALIFLATLSVRFFTKAKFPSLRNRLFGCIVICAIIDIALDIISSFYIIYCPHFDKVSVYLINSIFYSLQVIFPFLMLCFILVMCEKTNILKKYFLIFMLPTFLLIIGLIINPFTGTFFYINELGEYIHAQYFAILYAGDIVYQIATIFFSILYKKNLTKDEFASVCSIQLIIFAAMGIQFFYTHLLLSGVAIALSIVMMYFSMQNPEDYLDTMTGAFNYNALVIYLKNMQQSKKHYALVAVDIHGLKRVNNIFGIVPGNILLHRIVDFLKEEPNCLVFRNFGTRFVVALLNPDEYENYIKNIFIRFEFTWTVSEMEMMAGASVRGIRDNKSFKTYEDIINILDLSFSLDRQGDERSLDSMKDSVILSQEKRRIFIEHSMKNSLDHDGAGFSIKLQPIFNIKKNCFTCAEVLIRFQCDELGELSPSEFIPIAEHNGMIFEVDKMVVRRACELLKSQSLFKDLGLEYLEVNLSAAEFINDELMIDIISIIEEYEIPSEMIVFEITETVATSAHEILRPIMEGMIKKGFRFALDDFGTGHANVVQVVNLPFFCVKLDRELLTNDEIDSCSIVFEDSIRMFHRLGLVIVSEGVETAAQAEYVKQCSADYIQGYYYSSPIVGEQFSDFLKKTPAEG